MDSFPNTEMTDVQQNVTVSSFFDTSKNEKNISKAKEGESHTGGHSETDEYSNDDVDHEESEEEDNLKKSDDFKKIRKLTKLLTAVKSKNHGKSNRRKSLTEPVGKNK